MITIEQQIAALERQKRLRLHLLDDDGSMMEAILSTLRAHAELEADARRYRWLKTRINWNDHHRIYGALSCDQREWTHVDVRGASDRPTNEHIDEYIDGRLHRGEA